MAKTEITNKDLRALAAFFSDYMNDENELEDKDLDNAVNKIFNITHWFDE